MQGQKKKVTIFWFRRDLRLNDNHALFEALNGKYPVQCIFIFDRNILDDLTTKDPRVEFIHQEILAISKTIKAKGANLDVRHGDYLEVWATLLKGYDIQNVYANRDYEPYARQRDEKVHSLLATKGIEFKAKKDHVIFEKAEVLKKDTSPYTVFTPYSKVWKSLISERTFHDYPSDKIDNWHKCSPTQIISLKALGFSPSGIKFPSRSPDLQVIKLYDAQRDLPAISGTSRLGLHLRFGTISIRNLAKIAIAHNIKYLNELIWRDFYISILWHFPHVVGNNFRAKYDLVKWRNNQEDFEKWTSGQTGYPIVDAGMRELNATGFMHNRIRMVTASFLTKHLLIDWRWGEAYFAKQLLDYDLASNNGGWQWAAGTGVDAAPYFRIFNPYTQTQKFDPDLKYVKKWVPEFQDSNYPAPMVDHKFARERALKTYKEGLNDIA